MSSANEVRQRRADGEPVTATALSSTPSSQAKTTKAGKNNNLRSIILFVLFAGLGYIGYTYFTTAAGPRTFTPRQLSAYDGSNPDLPLYISIGGEVYDVSANRRVYGKGGAYNIMAGRDASRAFITGCFETHLTHDLRGLDDEQLKQLYTWKDFFANSDKYPHVGHLDLPELTDADPIPEMCSNPKTA